jgi:hypothetical protein
MSSAIKMSLPTIAAALHLAMYFLRMTHPLRSKHYFPVAFPSSEIKRSAMQSLSGCHFST